MPTWAIILIILGVTFVPSLIAWIRKKMKIDDNYLSEDEEYYNEEDEELNEFDDEEEQLEWALYLFGLTSDSNMKELEKIYKKLIVLYHPDQNDSNKGNVERTIELNNARDFLKQYWKDHGSWN